MAKHDKGAHEASGAAVATETEKTEETPVVTTPETATPEAAPAEEPTPAPATAEIDNATIAEQIANADPGSVSTATTKMSKEAMALPQERKRVAVKLGGLRALCAELKPAILDLMSKDAKSMTRSERDFYFGLVRSADAIEDMSIEGTDVLCGKQPKKRGGPFED